MTANRRTLDPATVAELRRMAVGNPGFLPQLVAIFVANAPGRLSAIRDAITRQDGAAIENIAHTLKSNCSMLGALGMADFCGQFEALAAARAFDDAAALWEDAKAEFERVRAEVEGLCRPPA